MVALTGAAVAALLTWLVTAHLNAQNEFRQLRGAIWLVQTELRENAARLRSTDPVIAGKNRLLLRGWPAIVARLRSPDRTIKDKDRLLLGDWITAKVAFAGLADYNKTLFEDVARTYGQISDFKSARGGHKPTDVELDALADRLSKEGDALKSRHRVLNRVRHPLSWRAA